jgi:hypothetical protein
MEFISHSCRKCKTNLYRLRRDEARNRAGGRILIAAVKTMTTRNDPYTSEVLDAVRALEPRIREAANAIEAERRLPPDIAP